MAKQKCKEGECTEEEMNADYERLRHIYDEEIHYQMNTRWNFTILLQERIQSSKHYHCDLSGLGGRMLPDGIAFVALVSNNDFSSGTL